MTIESQCAELRWKIENAVGVSDRLRRTADLLDFCQNALSSPDLRIQSVVFQEIAYLLNKRMCDSELWDWLQEVARSADQERQIAMRIAIFELIPDPPIIWSDVFRLWDMWFDPQARWAVYAAYRPFPRRIHQHLRRYVAHRRRQNLPIPEFSDEKRHHQGGPTCSS